MTLDKAGSLFVAGGTGRPSYHTGDSIVKFTDDGTPVWTNYHPFGFVFLFSRLSVDQEGHVIATAESPAYVVMKCSKEGVSLWTNALVRPLYSGGGVPQTRIDPAGNVFLIGGSPGASLGLYQILKINSAGIPLWTNLNANFGTTNSIIGASAVDNAGNLYLTGSAPANNGERDWVTMKFSGDGQLVWSNRFNGTADQEDIPLAIAVSPTGELYVAGRSEGQNGRSDFATVKYADSLFYSPPKDFVGVDTITYSLTDHLGNSTTESVDILVLPGAFHFDLSPTATRMTCAGMVLQLHGAPRNNPVVLEASPDTVWWQRIATNTPVQGSVQFLDSSVTNVAKRFYRVSQEQ